MLFKIGEMVRYIPSNSIGVIIAIRRNDENFVVIGFKDKPILIGYMNNIHNSFHHYHYTHNYIKNYKYMWIPDLSNLEKL